MVAFSAAHTAEKLRAPAVEQSLLLSAAQAATEARQSVSPTDASIPKSASLSGSPTGDLGAITGITSVAGTVPPANGDRCSPELTLAAAPGAMIQLTLSAPCNRSEKIVVRHSGLSFSARTGSDGRAVAVLPALKSEAMVAVYLNDARLVLGKVDVPDAASYTRFAIVWEHPTELELRVNEDGKVLVGSDVLSGGAAHPVMALGSTSVQSPVLARVYSVRGEDFGAADITGELRITPATCGRTLRVETVLSVAGTVTPAERSISVPLCGTSGDILVLKNLAPALKLAAPE
ncbi:hypothetical protein [Tabrizicola sp.]|uniref:hypothetical protein n=1 Tax=Tabrizicola sp. TaxID=2005166 RepID=UPI003F678288